MKFARYWTRREGQATNSDGESVDVVSRGWSDVSVEDAGVCAEARARRLAERLLKDRKAANLYDYADAPVPEPIVQDFRGQGTPAVVTRNSYGTLVLNTDDLLFADVDRDGALKHGPIDRVAAKYGFSLRVYQTAAGHRIMVTNRKVRGGSDEAETILTAFESDPLYMRLCRTQQSFRARLTPKPWRVGVRKPRVRFPFEDQYAKEMFKSWESEYNTAIVPFATCRLIRTLGDGVDPSFGKLIEFHDQETKAASNLPLG